ncbi:MAG TPA: beta-eliminating lyase-related protein [Rhizomicrobium sp.]
MNFASDNAYGAAPEIVAALAAANTGTVASYGEDELTASVTRRLCEIFEREVAVFPVVTGTAANSLSLATVSPPYGAIFCHEESHIAVDECAAPEFFSGGAKLVHLKGKGAKITPDAVSAALVHYRRGVHSAQPAAISITQATELGTVYGADEIAALAELAHREGMALHMDGARFANALAHLNCRAADITWRAGVDVLSFGATKNGALCAEAVVFFNESLVRDFEYRRKRGGHLISKMRFISAQLDAYLENDRWLAQARAANALATRLASNLAAIPEVEIAEAAEANEVFAFLPDPMVARLREAGAKFYDWAEPREGRTLVRLVLSFLTPDDDVQRFIQLAQR